jgi:hypothetical protein
LGSCSRRLASLPEASAELLSAIDVADPKAAVQMVRGFWQVEGDAWRWTRGDFAVVLKSPERASRAGARLELKLSLPASSLERLGPIRVRAAVNQLPLPEETYSQAGEYLYVREVPAAALIDNEVLVEFTADKTMPPAPDNGDRELALIAYRVGLTEMGVTEK